MLGYVKRLWGSEAVEYSKLTNVPLRAKAHAHPEVCFDDFGEAHILPIKGWSEEITGLTIADALEAEVEGDLDMIFVDVHIPEA